MKAKLSLITLATLAFVQQAQAQDPNAGKDFFRAQCGLCHKAEPGDSGGAQGPSLVDVFGQEAASQEGFAYTQALREADITWNTETLHRFLANPTETVPGTSMVVAVPDEENRANVVAYFRALSEGTFEEKQQTAGGFGGGGFEPPEPGPAPEGDPDWQEDRPGRVHRVDVDNLPEPYATGSAMNFPRLVEKPEGAELQVPEGFEVEVYTDQLQAPRGMVVAPNGDVFVTETLGGRIKVMRPNADGTQPQRIETFAQGLVQPLGMAFYPVEGEPQWLYVAETNRVVRYPYQEGDMVASKVPEVVVSQLSPVGGGHYTRDLAFSADGKHMYVSVGSQSNVAEDMPKKTAEEVQAWEAEHGLGAAWGNEENRAAVLEFEVGSEGAGKLFATGLRNCVGLTRQPATGDLWCTVNERDQLGDELVPDYSTRLQDGGFYGWPWYYMGEYEDPRLAGDRPDLAGKAIVPDVPYTAHSASVDLEFYPLEPSGGSAFPEEYAGQGFSVLHGSWNRAHRTGHKVVMLPIEDGEPTGEYIDFLTGFIAPDGNPWGRPVAITVAEDGSLLLSDDGANLVYRISYTR